MNSDKSFVFEIQIEQPKINTLEYSIFDIAKILDMAPYNILEIVYKSEINRIQSGQLDLRTFIRFYDKLKAETLSRRSGDAKF